ncbi:MAG: hypothetical protein KDC54_04880, partial [Lewinella sp.]|nr:hypothetical protein [Lewinella sp.]
MIAPRPRLTLLFILMAALFGPSAWAQQRSYLLNPGFEDTPGHSRPPEKWADCGFPGESPPDVQPNDVFQLRAVPYSGRSFMSMVTRDNNTWERAGAALTAPLQQGTCYRFSIHLARADLFLSYSRATGIEANYDEPVRLRIWGARTMCALDELLGVTPPVDHRAWQRYEFMLRPEQGSYDHIVLEAFYDDVTAEPYNG